MMRNGSRPSQKGPEQYSTGVVRIDPIVQAPDPSRVTAGLVTFEPGARSAWYTHPLGQTLITTQGVGLTQCEGEPIAKSSGLMPAEPPALARRDDHNGNGAYRHY